METPEYYVGGYFGPAGDTHFSPNTRFYDQKPPENFAIDDLLDFPKDDEVMTEAFFDNLNGNSSNSSTVTAVDSCNSSFSGSENLFSGKASFSDNQFSSELCVPYDDLAELEWLSNFVEDSFSGDDLQNYQLLNDTKASFNSKSSGTVSDSMPAGTNPPIFRSDVSVPGKARSKRSRAAPCDWSSRLLVLSPAASTNEIIPATKTPSKKRDTAETPGRKCLHCGSEKTPQWRSGPLGPKTLCNACGVRFKSGRLVPEYRPAASPTFVSAKHSNSHRKVMELRRQKDVQRHHHHHHQHQFINQSSIFGVSNGCDDYLIHRQSGPDYRHLI